MGLPVNSRNYRSDLVHPAAYEACQENCCAIQLSQALNLDYTRFWNELKESFEAHAYPGEFDYATMEMVLEWAKKHGHSCYFLKHGQLLYKHVIDGHKPAIAFTEDQNHFLLCTTTAPLPEHAGPRRC